MVSSVHAAASASLSGKGASSVGSTASSGGASTSPDAFLFSLLAMSSAGGAGPNTSSAELQGSEGKAAGGGDSLPIDGNVSPLSADNNLSSLLAFLLSALPPQAVGQSSANASSAADGDPSSSFAAVSGQSGGQDLLKQLAAALQLYRSSGQSSSDDVGVLQSVNGAPYGTASTDLASQGSTPLPAALLRELMQAHSARPIGDDPNELPQALKEAIAKLVNAGKNPGTGNASDAGADFPTRAGLSTVANAASAKASVDSAASGLARPLPGTASEIAVAIRQLLSSLKDTGAAAGSVGDAVRRNEDFPRAAANTAVLPATETDSTLDSWVDALTARFDTAAAGRNGAQTQAVMNLEARHLLREIGVDRASDTSPSQPSAVVASHGLAVQPNTGAMSTNIPVLQLNTPMNRPEWADGLSERIIWMGDHNLSNAQIRLNPPHLGPIEVSVSVSDDQTNVSFVAHHVATREALEAAAPRLRETLNAHGLGGVHVSVNHQSSSERSAQGQGHRYEAGFGFEPVFEASPASGPIRSASRTLIDTYA